MIRINLQLFAHKKGMGAQKTVAIVNLKDLVLKEATVSLYWQAIYW